MAKPKPTPGKTHFFDNQPDFIPPASAGDSGLTYSEGMTVSPNDPPLKPWSVTPEKIRDAVQRIVSAARPLRVIAFGSVVREGAEYANDLDVIVIEKHVEDRYGETIRLRHALRGLLMPIDLIVMSERDFEERSSIAGTVAYTALREGQVLYDAA